MWAERRTTIVSDDGGHGAVEAAALWVHLDRAGRRPTPLLGSELDTFTEAAGGRRVSARLSHPRPHGSVEQWDWRFRHTECDLAGHVNNSAYLRPLEDEPLRRGGTEPHRIDVELEFRTPALPGHKLILSDGQRR